MMHQSPNGKAMLGGYEVESLYRVAMLLDRFGFWDRKTLNVEDFDDIGAMFFLRRTYAVKKALRLAKIEVAKDKVKEAQSRLDELTDYGAAQCTGS